VRVTTVPKSVGPTEEEVAREKVYMQAVDARRIGVPGRRTSGYGYHRSTIGGSLRGAGDVFDEWPLSPARAL
jgi:hypothetical protein